MWVRERKYPETSRRVQIKKQNKQTRHCQRQGCKEAGQGIMLVTRTSDWEKGSPRAWEFRIEMGG